MARRSYVPMLAVLAGAALVGLLVYGVSAQPASRTLDEAVKRGQRPLAPSSGRLLPVLGGAAHDSLAAYRGHVVVLNFWASWCEPCRVEAPLLERAQRALARHRATVLGVAYKDATPDSESFVKTFRLTYPNLRDSEGEFAGAYGSDQIPESFLVDRQGRIEAISRGEVNEAFLRRAVSLAESS